MLLEPLALDSSLFLLDFNNSAFLDSLRSRARFSALPTELLLLRLHKCIAFGWQVPASVDPHWRVVMHSCCGFPIACLITITWFKPIIIVVILTPQRSCLGDVARRGLSSHSSDVPGSLLRWCFLLVSQHKSWVIGLVTRYIELPHRLQLSCGGLDKNTFLPLLYLPRYRLKLLLCLLPVFELLGAVFRIKIRALILIWKFWRELRSVLNAAFTPTPTLGLRENGHDSPVFLRSLNVIY